MTTIKNYGEKWTSLFEVANEEFSHSNAEFWGMSERKDKSANLRYGLFVDIKSFNDTPVISLLCVPPLYLIRWSNKSGRIESGYNLRNHQPDLARSYVYLVNNSNLIEWFIEESGGVHLHLRESDKIKHYAILTSEDILDVLCLCTPDVFE